MREATMQRMPQSIIQVFKDSIVAIRKNQLKEKALKIGDKVPDIPLTTVDNNNTFISELLKTDFLILNFYRGGWCPYCNLELREYERLRKDFLQINTDVIGISAEIPERTIQTSNKNKLTIPLLVDIDAKFMKEIGIVFRLDEASKNEYKNFGMDFIQIHGNSNFELPVPAVYVINTNMEIIYTHFEEDYMTRLEPTTLFNHIKSNILIQKN